MMVQGGCRGRRSEAGGRRPEARPLTSDLQPPTSELERSESQPPTRNFATSSIGFWVADKPMRCKEEAEQCFPADSGPLTSAVNRSMLNAKCDPRRLPNTAWISSTINVRAVASTFRPDAEVSSRYNDSGVVT